MSNSESAAAQAEGFRPHRVYREACAFKTAILDRRPNVAGKIGPLARSDERDRAWIEQTVERPDRHGGCHCYGCACARGSTLRRPCFTSAWRIPARRAGRARVAPD